MAHITSFSRTLFNGSLMLSGTKFLTLLTWLKPKFQFYLLWILLLQMWHLFFNQTISFHLEYLLFPSWSPPVKSHIPLSNPSQLPTTAYHLPPTLKIQVDRISPLYITHYTVWCLRAGLATSNGIPGTRHALNRHFLNYIEVMLHQIWGQSTEL